jgi:preprotein translocase subunit SecA
MKFDLSEYVQRAPHFAIVDECDSILVDEARTPLIISGPAESSTDKYYTIDKIIPFLKKDLHFTMEEKSKSATLTEEGNTEVEKLLKLDNLYDPANIEILHHVVQALKAHHMYRLDVEYMIQNGEIVIVDEFTGNFSGGSVGSLTINKKLSLNASGASILNYKGNPDILSQVLVGGSIINKL